MGEIFSEMGGTSSQDLWVDAMLKNEDVDADKLWKEYDKDESGELDKEEAKQVAKDMANAMVEAYAKGVDQAWDKMSSEERQQLEMFGGKKMLEAMKPMVEAAAEQIKTEEAFAQMFEAMDADGSDKVSREEFNEFLKNGAKNYGPDMNAGECPMQ